MSSPTKKVLSVFGLVMINVSLIASLRGLPLMAEYGPAIIFFLLVAVMVFLIPSSLASAELATGWPKKGGIYVWVKEAFGMKWGFLATWLQWVQNLVFYATALAAVAATLAYLFDNPTLADSKFFTILVILIVYWGATMLNFEGLKVSAWFTSLGTITGILIPGGLLITLAIIWITVGNPVEISFTWQNIVPDFSNLNNIAFFSGIMLFFAGMEVSAVHAQEVKNPQKDYPKAIFISAIIIVLIFLLGSLAVGMIVPKSEISLTAGIMETFMKIFNAFGIKWMVIVIALLASPGMIAQISTWIAGPSKGLLATADDGNLPPFFQQTNEHGVPTHILIVQGLIVTILSLVFIIMPSVSSSFWILTALTAQLYLMMYLFLFASVIKLRYSKPNVKRAFRIPWGKFGVWFFAGLGILAALGAIGLGFIPPSQLETGGLGFYEAFLAIGMIILVSAPLIIYQFRKESWKQQINQNKK